VKITIGNSLYRRIIYLLPLSVAKQQIRVRYQKQLIKLGLHIRQIRERQGISQEQLAADAEIPYSSVNEIEGGKTNPTIASLMALAEALDIPLSELTEF
jgi:DNA-binding XRE family transcriptional regulator